MPPPGAATITPKPVDIAEDYLFKLQKQLGHDKLELLDDVFMISLRNALLDMYNLGVSDGLHAIHNGDSSSNRSPHLPKSVADRHHRATARRRTTTMTAAASSQEKT
jgi:hypothetical protein